MLGSLDSLIATAVLGVDMAPNVRGRGLAWLAADAWRGRRFVEAVALTGAFLIVTGGTLASDS